MLRDADGSWYHASAVTRDDVADLIRRARAGEAEALEEVFARYRGRIQGLVRRKLGGGLRTNLDSSDVVQSVCLEAMRSIGELEYKNEDGFVHWLARIAENTIRDKHRYFGAQKRRAPSGADEEAPVPISQAAAADPTPSRTVGQVEQMELVLQALRRLPDDYRRIIQLTRFEKKSHEEAARVMGKTVKATRMLLARARVRLLRELDRRLEGGDA